MRLQTNRRAGMTIWNVLLIAAGIAMLVLAVAGYHFYSRAHRSALLGRCIGNLKQIESAKYQWGLENKITNAAAVPTEKDLTYLKVFPVCRSGGIYTIGPLSERPRCSFPGHSL